jgi:hypothetical protein
MKIWLLTILLATNILASPCDTSWGDEKKPLTTCRLEWGGGPDKAQGVELVEYEKMCGMEGGGLEDCAILRACGPGKGGDKGASVFKNSKDLSKYCDKAYEREVFSPYDKYSPRAFVVCEGVGRPKGIKLTSPDGKLTKLCPYPFAATVPETKKVVP